LEAAVDPRGGLDVITVCPEWFFPACGHSPEGRAVHDLLGVTTEPVHLPDRLLSQYGRHRAAMGPERINVTRGGQTQPVSGARGGPLAPDQRGLQVGEAFPQGRSVPGAQWPFEYLTTVSFGRNALEGREQSSICRRDAQQVRTQIDIGAAGFVLQCHNFSKFRQGRSLPNRAVSPAQREHSVV